MENVIIKVKSRNDSRFLEQLAKKMGFESLVISDFELRLQARKRIVDIAESNPVSEMGENEIQQIVKQVRAKRHAKN
jgi:hypothetical protein